MSRARTAVVPAPARPSLTFYPAEVDGSPAAFVVDLEQEPRKALSTRIVVAVPMRDPTDDGLRSEDEMAALDGVQEKIADRLGKAHSAEHVGFYDLNGATTLVFYAPDKTTAASVAKAIGDIGPYALDVHVAKDAEWRFYIDVLFPDAYALQGIWNRALIDELESHGDELEEPRDVDHLVTFPSKALAEKAAKRLEGAHFHLDGIDPHEEEKGRYAVTFHRSETLEGDKPNQFSAEILDLILPLDGEYDGWGSPAVGGEQAAPKPKPKKSAKASKPKPTKKPAAAPKPKPTKKSAPAPKAKPPKKSAAAPKPKPTKKSTRAAQSKPPKKSAARPRR